MKAGTVKKTLACVALASITVGVYGCQPEDLPLGSANCPIVNGEPDTSPEHMAVVYLYMVSGTTAGACTGTLIASRIVLTAAHCIHGVSPDSVTVYFGNDSIFGQARHVSDVEWHPDYSSQHNLNDIGLLRLSEDPPADIEPIPFLPHAMGITTSDIGTQLEFVGFGQTSASDPYSAGIKMSMTNDLAWVCYSESCSGWNNPAYPNTFCQDQTPSGVCFGDSGGPAFILRLGREYTAGVASYVGPDCEQFGCHTKVDEFEDFIYSFAGEPNGTPCSENADCLSNACADGVCCENACAGRCQGCNQPGHAGECIPLPNGTPCPDTDVCNGEELCYNGSCQQGKPMVCHDDIDCTVDACDPTRGCVFQPLAADCDDQEICTLDICDPEVGCIYEPHQDGLECAKNMYCLFGVCTKEPSPEDCGCASTSTGVPPLLLFAFLMFRTTRRAVAAGKRWR
jgi:hypothetical protein